MATGSSIAAWIEPAFAMPFALAASVVAIAARRPWLVVAAVVACAGARGHAEAERYRPLDAGRFDGAIALVTDPEERSFGWVAEVRLLDGPDAGARVQLSVPWSAGDLGRAVAGSRLQVDGTVSTIEVGSYVRSRHLRGRLNADRIDVEAGPRWWRAPSEFVRRQVVSGSLGLPEEHRDLYLGLVIGDDRDQRLSQQATFRVAGMSHLLAVSGQNVAFVLSVMAPVLARVSPCVRWVLVIALLAMFAIATRLEPSVLRATVTATIAATAVVAGRRSVGVRTLALAVTAIVIIDPFLTRSVGFVLSVTASLGIVVLGPAITARIRGPRVVAEAIAITVSAQLAVAPVLIGVFGPVSLASLPANVLAGWAAGVVMMWGASVGLVVGLLPPSFQQIVSRPPAVLVWWIDAVAAWAVRWPLPSIGSTGLLGLLAIVSGWWWMGRWRWRWRIAMVLGTSLLALTATAPPLGVLSDGVTLRNEPVELSSGALVLDGTPTIVVLERSPSRGVVEALIEQRLGSIDLLVVARGDRWSAGIAQAVREVANVGVVVAPPGHRVIGARTIHDSLVIETERGRAVVRLDGGSLAVEFG